MEVGGGSASLVLKLDVDGPQPACSEMGFETFLDHFLGLVESSASHSLHDSLKLDLPLALGQVFGNVHDLESSFVFLDDLEVLRILKHGNRHLLLRYFKTGPLDAKSCLFQETLVEHNARSDEPNLPLDVVGTLQESLSQVGNGFRVGTNAIVSLCRLDLNLPVELLVDVLEEVADDRGESFELLGSQLVVALLVEAQVLEPEGTVFAVILEPLVADVDGVLDLVLALLVLGGLQEDGAVVPALLQQELELLSGLHSVAASALEESAFEENSPVLLDGDVSVSSDVLDHFSDFVEVVHLFFDLDSFDKQVLAEWIKVQSLEQNITALLLVATLLFHFGVLEPSLISIWLLRNHNLKEVPRFVKLAFSLSIVSEIQVDSPLDFLGHLHCDHLGQDVFDNHLVRIVGFLALLHFSCDVLVFIFGNGRFDDVLLKSVHLLRLDFEWLSLDDGSLDLLDLEFLNLLREELLPAVADLGCVDLAGHAHFLVRAREEDRVFEAEGALLRNEAAEGLLVILRTSA